MDTISLKLKRSINEVHNRLQNIVCPLGFQPASQAPSPLDMPIAFPGGPSAPTGNHQLPDVSVFPNTDQPLSQRLTDLRKDFNLFFEHLKYCIMIPLSWWLTMAKFVRVIIWRLLTLPLRISINFYERYVRRAFPWLPSIWGTLFILFPGGIKLPTFTSLTAGPYKGAGPIGQHATLEVDLDAIINVEQDEANDHGAANGDASSQITSSRSKLDVALKRIVTVSPGDLDAGLADVKTAQEETEKLLALSKSSN
ncbi:hypothetical protein BJV78DRAFT_817438 [Lactifluus subvellereus]|nr:hypothetical protein BJV78DRAFT_817438 [Lactifluus subvellereus]